MKVVRFAIRDNPLDTSALRPMRDFDPSRPALLYDELNDVLIPWDGDADDWREHASLHDQERDLWNYDGSLIPGWLPRTEGP